MTEVTEQATRPFVVGRGNDMRVIGVVSAAHFVSHYYILILPPLFAFVRADYHASYTELGFALAAFNIVTAVLQTPAGFLVDRLGARLPLIAGLLLGAVSFAAAGLVDSFWLFVAMFALAGAGNAVYHPADYAMLSRHVSAERIGKAFSVHTFSGMLGSAAAPASLLLMQSYWGWRGAFLGAAALGVVVAAALMLQPDETPAKTHTAARADNGGGTWQLLTSLPILLNLVFFILLALTSAGLQNYSVVALNALHGTPVAIANTALSAHLLLSALAVLAGGLVVTRTARHTTVTVLALAGIAVTTLALATFDFSPLWLILVMAADGFFFGVMMPARDMIVRAITPAGSFGKVFGFVTTGFNIGGIAAPLIFGPVMDHGSPAAVFMLVVAFCLMSMAAVTMQKGRRRAA